MPHIFRDGINRSYIGMCSFICSPACAYVCVCLWGGGCVCSWFNSEEERLNLSRKKKICEKNKSTEMKKVKITFFLSVIILKIGHSSFHRHISENFIFFFSFCTRKGHFLQVFYFTLCRKADWLMIGIYKKSCFERCFEPVTRRFRWKKKTKTWNCHQKHKNVLPLISFNRRLNSTFPTNRTRKNIC